ncbi:peptidase A4 family-domain-containing protein [Mycena galopus ATCC 62051]|nr:peptidase A4 family-domain-containing protein [Mycena galopus ATCC 62051]
MAAPSSNFTFHAPPFKHPLLPTLYARLPPRMHAWPNFGCPFKRLPPHLARPSRTSNACLPAHCTLRTPTPHFEHTYFEHPSALQTPTHPLTSHVRTNAPTPTTHFTQPTSLIPHTSRICHAALPTQPIVLRPPTSHPRFTPNAPPTHLSRPLLDWSTLRSAPRRPTPGDTSLTPCYLDTCGGTLSEIVSSGQENFAWTEMLPASLCEVSLTINTGDSITTNITMTSKTSGTATIENNTRGTSIISTVSGGTSLSSTSAKWILEDFESGSSLVAFAGFPTSTFTGSAIHSGTSVSHATATLISIVQNSEQSSGTPSGTTISVKDS